MIKLLYHLKIHVNLKLFLVITMKGEDICEIFKEIFQDYYN